MEKILRKEIVAPIIILLFCVILCIISKKVLKRIFKRLSNSDTGRKKTILNLINNIVIFIIVILGVLSLLEVYGIDTKSLIASLGIVGLVTGLALQDLLKDFIVGVSIIFEDQFSIGDWISIGGFKGEVMPSNLRTTKLKAYTGEVKIIYNRNITEITNYTRENANLILDIGVSYDSDIKKVRQVLDDLCLKIKEKYRLEEISCLGVQELSESSINFRIVVRAEYSEQFSLDRKIKEEIVNIFNKNNITIPYKQVVVHNG